MHKRRAGLALTGVTPLLAVTMLLGGCSSGPSASPPSSSPATTVAPDGAAATLVATATSDARRSAGVHVDFEVRLGSSGSESATGTVGQDWGSVAETLEVQGRTALVTIELIGKTIYVRGNQAGLLTQPLGITSGSLASALANTWLAVPSTFSHFPQLQSGLTISSLMSELTLGEARFAPGSGAGSASPTVVGGLSAETGFTAGTACSEVVTRAGAGGPLPASITCAAASNQLAATFDQWGSARPPSVPPGARDITAALQGQ
jgi:hypothetical protein